MWKPEHRLTADRRSLRYPSDLSDAEWVLVAPMIPPARRGGRRRSVNVREVLNAIFYVLSTGCQWNAMPKDLPPKSTAHFYFLLWDWDGTLDRIHDALYVATREAAGSLANLTPKNPSDSTIFEWDGSIFKKFQSVPSAWGYNWHYFSISGDHFLAYADHILPSVIFHWNDTVFEPFQTLEGKGGRAFHFFEADGEAFLVFAKILGETLVYRWNGRTFVEHQILSGPGGREFAYLEYKGERYLIQVNFITGTPANPNTALQSVIYRLQAGQLKVVGIFPTFGATDAAVFSVGKQAFVAIAESLTKNVRFHTPSRIYRFGTE